jgi:hypothetical protein
MTRRKRAVATLFVTLISLLASVGMAKPAEATGYSAFGYNNYASYFVAACYDYTACRQTSSGNVYPGNGTPLQLVCWFDGSWQKGNYWTNRWFIVNIYGRSGLWVTTASYVMSQYAVRAC